MEGMLEKNEVSLAPGEGDIKS